MEDQEKILLANNTYLMLMIDFKIDKFNPETKVYEYAKEPDFEGVYQIFRQRGNHNVSTESFNDWLHKLLKERVDDYKNGNKIESYDLELLETVKLFLKWLKTRKDVYSSPFEEKILFGIWGKYNNSGIWESVEFTTFCEAFKGKGGLNILNGKKTSFCRILREEEEKRDTAIAPNMANWVKQTFDIAIDTYKQTAEKTRYF